MIDISDKKLTHRVAMASVVFEAPPLVIRKIKGKKLPKGDCLAAARVAAILAAKNTPALIPLCHPIRLTHADVRFIFKRGTIRIIAQVKANDATGAEMEALAACSVAALTIYDMAKTEEKEMRITDLRLLKKTGGKSGDYIAHRQ